MLRTMICAVFLVMVAAATSAAPKNGSGGSTSNVFRFIGYTDDATNTLPDAIDGGQGLLAMHALCQDDFGPEARTCTSREFWLSPNAEAHQDDLIYTWLHPDRVTNNLDFSGVVTASDSSSCSAWTRPEDNIRALSVNQGKSRLAACDILRPVTCCAPVQ